MQNRRGPATVSEEWPFAICHSVRTTGEGETVWQLTTLPPPSQETCLGIMTADFLRRTERMRLISILIRTPIQKLFAPSWEVCRQSKEDRPHEHCYQMR